MIDLAGKGEKILSVFCFAGLVELSTMLSPREFFAQHYEQPDAVARYDRFYRKKCIYCIWKASLHCAQLNAVSRNEQICLSSCIVDRSGELSFHFMYLFYVSFHFVSRLVCVITLLAGNALSNQDLMHKWTRQMSFEVSSSFAGVVTFFTAVRLFLGMHKLMFLKTSSC